MSVSDEAMRIIAGMSQIFHACCKQNGFGDGRKTPGAKTVKDKCNLVHLQKNHSCNRLQFSPQSP